MVRINYITSLDVNNYSGGWSGMNHKIIPIEVILGAGIIECPPATEENRPRVAEKFCFLFKKAVDLFAIELLWIVINAYIRCKTAVKIRGIRKCIGNSRPGR